MMIDSRDKGIDPGPTFRHSSDILTLAGEFDNQQTGLVSGADGATRFLTPGER